MSALDRLKRQLVGTPASEEDLAGLVPDVAEDWGDAGRMVAELESRPQAPVRPRPSVRVSQAGQVEGGPRPFASLAESAPSQEAMGGINPEVLARVSGSPAPVPDTGDAEFRAAQDAAKQRAQALAFGRAGAMANEAISGARFDRDAYDEMGRNTDAPVRELVAQREADRKKRLTDPTSEDSKRFQAAVQKAMPGVYSPEEIAQMTPADEKLLFQAGTLRQQLDARKAAEQQRAEDMAREDRRRGEDMAFRAEQAALQRQAQAGARADAASERALRREEMAAQRGQMADTRRAAFLEKDVQKAGEDLEGAGQFKSDLDYLDKMAAMEDVPGIGKWDSKKTGLLSAFASGDDTRTLQTTRSIVGRLLKERSGTAASDAEVERVMMELGMGPNASEAEFRAGVKRLRGDLTGVLQRRQAKYPTQVIDTYRERGGTTAEALAPPATPTASPPPPPAGKVRVSNGTESYDIDLADLADAKAEGFREVR